MFVQGWGGGQPPLCVGAGIQSLCPEVSLTEGLVETRGQEKTTHRPPEREPSAQSATERTTEGLEPHLHPSCWAERGPLEPETV